VLISTPFSYTVKKAIAPKFATGIALKNIAIRDLAKYSDRPKIVGIHYNDEEKLKQLR
jgi:hypothetical protein